MEEDSSSVAEDMAELKVIKPSIVAPSRNSFLIKDILSRRNSQDGDSHRTERQYDSGDTDDVQSELSDAGK